jgi:hypothetical protein
MGRGSQELGGSFVLGAWAEQSIFLEPVGRKGGGTSFDVQLKDAAAPTTLRLRFEAEGPAQEPWLIRLTWTTSSPSWPLARSTQTMSCSCSAPCLGAGPHGSGVTVKALSTASN